MSKVQIICGHCGSADVRRDTWAEWDSDKQDWVLGAVFDAGHCDVCEGERSLKEKSLDEWDRQREQSVDVGAYRLELEELPDGRWAVGVLDEDIAFVKTFGPLDDSEEAKDAARRWLVSEGMI